jgi:TonB family protein
MNRRLQTRSLVTSAVAHALLLALLLMAPGFRRARQDRLLSGPPLELVPGALVDATLARAATTSRTPAQTPRPRQQPQHRAPARPESERPEPPREPERAPFARERPPERPVPRAREEARRFDLSKARSIRELDSRTDSRQERRAESNARLRMRALDRQLASAAGSLARAAAAGAVEIQISGGGGSANAWHIRNAYDAAWLTPANVSDTLATTEVEVVVRGDGTVARSRIVRRSGIEALDRSVERALREVTRIEPFEPFPSGESITFTIAFNLKSRSDL